MRERYVKEGKIPDYRFSYRLRDFSEGTPLKALWDTEDYTCYEICGITVCKNKQADTMEAFARTFRDEAEFYVYLQSVTAADVSDSTSPITNPSEIDDYETIQENRIGRDDRRSARRDRLRHSAADA